MMELIDGAEAELVKSALRLITRLDYESRLGCPLFVVTTKILTIFTGHVDLTNNFNSEP